ncbi:MAG: class I SAM-dependent methyltransferase, partial [Chloroflexota bacterium]
GMLAVDVGCGPGDYAALLSRRHGCSVLGLDLALGTLQLALADQQLEDDLYFGQANIEAMPLPDQQVDLILCRDILLHVLDLEQGVAECSRVLRPDGSMIVLATVLGEDLSLEEAATRFESLGVVAGNLAQERLEAAFEQAGLTIHRTEVIGGERLEYYEEQSGYYSRELLRLARMQRDPQRYIQLLGAERYQVTVALYTLSISLLIGKLIDVVYWLKK